MMRRGLCALMALAVFGTSSTTSTTGGVEAVRLQGGWFRRQPQSTFEDAFQARLEARVRANGYYVPSDVGMYRDARQEFDNFRTNYDFILKEALEADHVMGSKFL